MAKKRISLQTGGAAGAALPGFQYVDAAVLIHEPQFAAAAADFAGDLLCRDVAAYGHFDRRVNMGEGRLPRDVVPGVLRDGHANGRKAGGERDRFARAWLGRGGY